MKTIILGAVLGGLTLFLWSFVSWMVLPWHNHYLQVFADEAAVGDVLKANAPVPGLYRMPGEGGGEKSKDDWKEGAQRITEGPFLFGVVRTTRAEWNFGRLLLGALLIQMVGAFIITALLLTTRIPKYFGRVLFVTTIAGLVGILGHLPNYNWWEFPAGWTLVNIADLVIGWFLGGLVLAALTRPKAAPVQL